MVAYITLSGAFWGRADLRSVADRPVDVLRAEGPGAGSGSTIGALPSAMRSWIKRVYVDNFCVYAARKIWKQLNRESIRIARCA
jgi:hypothetical protein